jgi:plasmid stabilization system protein ParE
MKVIRLPSFWRDLQGIVDYLCDAKEEKKALRLARAIDETIDLIERFPDAGNPWESPDPDLAKMRFRLVKRFKRYLIVYERVKKEVVIHRVFHGSQNVEALLKG